jgi:hypothetical protein
MDPDPDPTPDLTPFFSDFKDAKKNFILFSLKLPTGTLSSFLKTEVVINFLLKFYFASIISVL